MRKQFFVCDRPLLAGLEIFHTQPRPFVPEDDGKARPALLGQSKLPRHFCRRQRIIHPMAVIPQMLHHGKGISPLFFFCDYDVNLNRAFGGDRPFHLRAGSRVAANHFAENDVTNGETQRGQ